MTYDLAPEIFAGSPPSPPGTSGPCQRGWDKLLDTMLEILRLGLVCPLTYRGVDDATLAAGLSLGEVAAADPGLRVEVEDAGGSAAWIANQLAAVRISNALRSQLSAEFVRSYDAACRRGP